jgi:hypothetical protein
MDRIAVGAGIVLATDGSLRGGIAMYAEALFAAW